MPPEYVTRETCQQTSTALLESQQQLHSKLDSMERRLFRDNGSVSIQTRIDRHEQSLRLLLWIVGIIAGTMLISFTGTLALLIREAMLRGVHA